MRISSGIFVLSIAGFAVIAFLFLEWLNAPDPLPEKLNGTRIRFETFLSFYDIDPTPWILLENTVTYVPKAAFREEIINPYFEGDTFAFDWLDRKKYRRWYKALRRKEDKERMQRRDIAATERLIAGVKESLKRFEEEGKEYGRKKDVQ